MTEINHDYEISSCTGKIAFDSAIIANTVRRRRKGDNREAYRCENCGRWHLGHPPRDKKFKRHIPRSRQL